MFKLKKKMRRNSWHSANNCVWRFVSDFVILSKARYLSLGIMYKGKKKKWTCTNLKGDRWVNKTVCFLFADSRSQCASILKYVKRNHSQCKNNSTASHHFQLVECLSVFKLSALTSDPYISLDESCLLIKGETNTK